MRTIENPIYTYIEACYGNENEHMLKSRHFANQLGLGAISISQVEGHLMRFLLKLIRPRQIIEIGTLTGLSCQYFIQSLPEDGVIYSLEKSAEHLARATEALKPWISKGQCHLIEGDAQEKLIELTSKGPFDAIFIDGNKSAYMNYWLWAKKNIRSGGLVFIDNVFLAGSVWADDETALTGTGQKFSRKQIGVVKSMTQDLLNDSDFESAFVPTDEGLLLACRR